ncbi:MAG: ABC transporter substrate-binding protein [Desulfobacula sp.]|nr:ABC transporter substrate-binding protein [Desulfobacula sp.]
MKKILKKTAVAICQIFVFFLFFACSPPQQSTVIQENKTGITDTGILIGSSLALAGHAGYLGTQMLQGAMSYIRHINDSGGILGRKINLIALDDSYDPTQCLYNTQQLILAKQVFALFSYLVTPTTMRIIPLINDAKIPLVGMFTGANRLRQPVNRYLINIRASYYQETRAAVDLLVNKKNIDKIAVFYQYDEYGFDGLRGAEIALKKHGLIPVAKGSYIRGTLDVEAGLEKIMQSDAQAVVMIGTYDPCAKFIHLARARGYNPIFHNVSFVGSKELARRLGPAGEGVIVTQVVPPPHSDIQTEPLPGVRQYLSLLKQYYPDSKPSFVGLEGYLNARILVEGLRRSGKNITREKFIQAIESINNYDLGIQNLLSFGKNDNQGLDNVYYTIIKNGELVLLK